MSTTILTDAQIFDCFDTQCAEMVINFDADELYPVGRAIEQAVLQSDHIRKMDSMAACMHMVRNDLIEAGIIDASTAPMFLTEAVLAKVQPWRAMSDEYNELIRHIHGGGDALEFLSRRHGGKT